jgi:hypothetical protein
MSERVAVLFARKDSIYKTMPECDVWDIERDAREWPGGMPSAESASALAGFALLFASDGRHCLALIYSTSAEGEAAPRLIGERLGAMTRVTFERVRRLDIDQRVRVPRR